MKTYHSEMHFCKVSTKAPIGTKLLEILEDIPVSVKDTRCQYIQ